MDCDYRLEIRFWKVLANKLVANYAHGMDTFKRRGNSGTFPYGRIVDRDKLNKSVRS